MPETPHHVAPIVTIFQVLQTNWFCAGRARHSNSDYSPNRSLHLASAYNSGVSGIATNCRRLERKGEAKWKRGNKREREKRVRWNTHRIRIRTGLQRKSASLEWELQESNYGSSGSISAKNQGKSGRTGETNLSGLSGGWDAELNESGRRRRLRDLMS